MTIKNTLKNIKRKMLPFITTTVITTNGGNVQATPPNLKEQNCSKNKTTLTMPLPEEFFEDINPGYERKVKCNVYKLVEKRTDWLCQEYVAAASRRLDEIRRCSNKTIYVKKMFARMGHGYKYDKYCLVAQLSAFKDVTDKTGNLKNVLPTSAECTSFMQGLRNKGYADCLRTNPDFKTIRPGDMVFTPRGNGKYHCTSVKRTWKDNKGLYHVLLTSFNNDRNYELGTDKTYIVVNMHKLVSRALWKEMKNKGIITNKMLQKDIDQIISLDSYQKINIYLTKGMPEPKNKLTYNSEDKSDKNTQHPKQQQIAVWALRNSKEIG